MKYLSVIVALLFVTVIPAAAQTAAPHCVFGQGCLAKKLVELTVAARLAELGLEPATTPGALAADLFAMDTEAGGHDAAIHNAWIAALPQQYPGNEWANDFVIRSKDWEIAWLQKQVAGLQARPAPVAPAPALVQPAPIVIVQQPFYRAPDPWADTARQIRENGEFLRDTIQLALPHSQREIRCSSYLLGSFLQTDCR